MNREDMIRMALEAGIPAAKYPSLISDSDWEALERFAAIVASASEEQWKQAVINELVCCHIYNESHDQDPRKSVHDAISWNVEVALDPIVSSQAQALIDLGAAAEREACAITAWSTGMDLHMKQYDAREIGSACAKAIRARGNE